MIDQLSQIIRASNSFKIVLGYIGKIWRKSRCVYYDFIGCELYIVFTPLPRNASFLLKKHSCARGELGDVKNHCARTYFWWVCACAPHLWFVHLPNWHFSLHLPPLQCPWHVRSRQFQRLIFGNIQSPDKFTVKPKRRTMTKNPPMVRRIRRQEVGEDGMKV